MERFEIVKVNVHNDYASALIKDNEKHISFWIDYSKMDGYGNKQDFKTEDLYVDWDFNQYIFNLDNSLDIEQKEYQENAENLDYLDEFIDMNNDYLLSFL